MKKEARNVAASVRQRLANQGKERGIEFQRILVLYALERLLYRISVSPYSGEFILKGAMLLSLWFENLMGRQALPAEGKPCQRKASPASTPRQT